MRHTVDITSRSVQLSSWLSRAIRERAEHLFHLDPRIRRLRVVLSREGHSRHGSPCEARVEIDAPGLGFLVAKNEPRPDHDDVLAALSAALVAARRELESRRGRQRHRLH